MIVDTLANAFINITLFIFIVLFVKGIESKHDKNYTPPYWISIKKHDIKLFLWGIVAAIFYKISVSSLFGATSYVGKNY